MLRLAVRQHEVLIALALALSACASDPGDGEDIGAAGSGGSVVAGRVAGAGGFSGVAGQTGGSLAGMAGGAAPIAGMTGSPLAGMAGSPIAGMAGSPMAGMAGAPMAGTGGVPPLPSGCAQLPAIGDAFVTRQGAELRLGAAGFRSVGTNLYFLQEIGTRAAKGNADYQRQLDEVIDEAACRGMNVVRVWGYNDEAAKDSVIRRGPTDYVEEGFRGLDRAIARAKARGLRLIVTLANNWNEYGGIGENGYGRWATKSHDDFFTDATMQGYWKDYASKLADRVNVDTGVRYRDEPAIFAWEIANELRCQSCKGTRKVRDAIAVLAKHLKTVDPKHLVGDGGEGFDDDPTLYPGLTNTYAVRGDEGASYAALATIPELDLLSYHFYPVNWGLMSAADHDVWIDRHESIAKTAGKVAYLGEYGYKLDGNQRGAPADGPWTAMYGAWVDRLFVKNPGSVGLQWQLVPTGGPYDDEFAIRKADNPLVLGLLQRTGESLRR